MLKIEDYFEIKNYESDDSKKTVTMSMQEYFKELDRYGQVQIKKHNEMVTQPLRNVIIKQDYDLKLLVDLIRPLLKDNEVFEKHKDHLGQVLKSYNKEDIELFRNKIVGE